MDDWLEMAYEDRNGCGYDPDDDRDADYYEDDPSGPGCDGCGRDDCEGEGTEDCEGYLARQLEFARQDDYVARQERQMGRGCDY